jgi:hypothetical protein
MNNVADPLLAAGIRCYETFRGGSIAFEREGTLYFGPSERLSAFFSGSDESFLVGEAAQSAIAELRTQQGENPYRSTTPGGSDKDSLAQIRKRWQAERDDGQWSPEYVRAQLKGLR